MSPADAGLPVGLHLYNDVFISQRLRWRPDQPLVLGIVLVFRLAEPQQLPMRSRYAGCNSWVELEQPVSLAGAHPVIDQETFLERVGRLRAVLTGSSERASPDAPPGV